MYHSSNSIFSAINEMYNYVSLIPCAVMALMINTVMLLWYGRLRMKWSELQIVDLNMYITRWTIILCIIQLHTMRAVIKTVSVSLFLSV